MRRLKFDTFNTDCSLTSAAEPREDSCRFSTHSGREQPVILSGRDDRLPDVVGHVAKDFVA